MASIACIVPTFNGKEELIRLFRSLQTQSAQFDVLIVDSSSRDGTLEVALDYAREVVVIPTADFNHGGTRQLMVEKFPDYEFYVFITQDAVLEGVDAVKNLVAALDDPDVGASCGRQLPHDNANFFAAHARIFNYPGHIRVRGKEDIGSVGIKATFISNSFSAYRRKALLKVGGFPHDVILAEDMYVAAKMIMDGWKIAYVGNALCKHSHNYTVAQEFRRYFDTGVFHAQQPWIMKEFGGAGGEGKRFFVSEIRAAVASRPWLIPSVFIRSFAKIAGFKAGLAHSRLPISLKRRLSMHWRFWSSS